MRKIEKVLMVSVEHQKLNSSNRLFQFLKQEGMLENFFSQFWVVKACQKDKEWILISDLHRVTTLNPQIFWEKRIIKITSNYFFRGSNSNSSIAINAVLNLLPHIGCWMIAPYILWLTQSWIWLYNRKYLYDRGHIWFHEMFHRPCNEIHCPGSTESWKKTNPYPDGGAVICSDVFYNEQNKKDCTK